MEYQPGQLRDAQPERELKELLCAEIYQIDEVMMVTSVLLDTALYIIRIVGLCLCPHVIYHIELGL